MRDVQREAYWHMQDCRALGMTPAEIIHSCEQPIPERPTWSDAAYALYRAWMGLQRPEEQRVIPRVLEAA